ncbi:hypothetical protein AXG93_441s1230 [Marchantia polymorpha subsp. ruderalis]|uniref:Uncharacterized protein n=1 Tax=Marchantia polymorpha subsp. ruderalis TaxID=1480154 RepID=A0A176W487_MARPO|nr:hypothetical protein AXG93_441s1230 [Marchantia polymorpha subsp. ruderalis]
MPLGEKADNNDVQEIQTVEVVSSKEREEQEVTVQPQVEENPVVREVEVDTDLDKVLAITPPRRLRIEVKPHGAKAPKKRKLGEEEEERQRELVAVPSRRRTTNEQARPKQKACKLILTAGSSADGPSRQVLFKVPSEEAPSALRPSTHIPTAKCKNAETRVPSAEEATKLPSTEQDWEDLAVSTEVGSPTPLEMLARQGMEAAAEEVVRPSARETPRVSAAIEILETEDDTPSEKQEV